MKRLALRSNQRLEVDLKVAQRLHEAALHQPVQRVYSRQQQVQAQASEHPRAQNTRGRGAPWGSAMLVFDSTMGLN